MTVWRPAYQYYQTDKSQSIGFMGSVVSNGFEWVLMGKAIGEYG